MDVMGVAVVGGGQASLLLLQYFRQVSYIRVRAVIDRNDAAPGLVIARQLGYPTFRDLDVLKDLRDVDTIIEVTGNETVKQLVLSHLKPHQHVMSARAAKIMSDFIDVQQRQRDEIVDRMSVELAAIATRMQASEEHIRRSVLEMENVVGAMKMLTMNARIEAVRAGESGRAFEVVVQSMQGTLKNIEAAVGLITSASKDSKAALAEMVATEHRLTTALRGE